MIKTSVSFETSDAALQTIYDRAEEIERGNIAVMDGRRAEATINGRSVFSVPAGYRVETTQHGELLRIDPIAVTQPSGLLD